MRPFGALAIAAALLAGCATASAQDHALTYHALRNSDLPSRQEPFPIWYSPSAEAEADQFADTMAEAVAWYREALAWEGPLRLAVLNAEDYARYAGQPYPVPYAEVVTGLVVMPDSVADFPGFDAWGLEDRALNTNLTFHEIGHAIARDIGLWSNSFFVNELVANVFLAGYLSATRPDDRSLLEGVPEGFADAARTQYLVDLDDLYSGVGLDNYAWFQFRLAEIADHMVAGRDFGALVADLRAAFPATETVAGGVMPTPEESFRRLEALAPGVTELAADMLGRPGLPGLSTIACGEDDGATTERGVILLENASHDTVRITTRNRARFAVRLDAFGADMSEAEIERLTDEALATGKYGLAIAPAHRYAFTQETAGTQLYIADGGCLIVPEGVGSYVWTGG